MSQIPAILQEIQDILKKENIPFTEVEGLIETYTYTPLPQYLNMLIHRVKPETATSELFKAIAGDVLRIEMLPEVSVKGGFVDFAIHQKETNPILLELKPAFKIAKSKQIIYPESLHYEYHKTQIQKYLLSNEYIILTNLRTVFLFSREALIDYQPFYLLILLQYDVYYRLLLHTKNRNLVLRLHHHDRSRPVISPLVCHQVLQQPQLSISKSPVHLERQGQKLLLPLHHLRHLPLQGYNYHLFANNFYIYRGHFSYFYLHPVCPS